MKRHTRQPYRFLPAFFLLVTVFFSVATAALSGLTTAPQAAAQEPTPSAIDILKASVAAQSPILNPFQVRAQFEVDGNQMADVTFGWSGGATASFRAKLPFMPGFGEIAGAIRPSGFALIKFGPTTQILAPLVPYSQILELIPRVFNRELLAELIVSQESAVRLVGETEIKGRRAYILEWQPSVESFAASLKNLFVKATSDEAVRTFLTGLGVPVDEIASYLNGDAWQQALAEIAAESKGEVPVYRYYVDTVDYVTLGEEFSASGTPELDEILQLLVPQVKIEDIAVGEDGHIQKLVWRIRMKMSREDVSSLAATLEEAAAAAAAEEIPAGEDEGVGGEEDPVTDEGVDSEVEATEAEPIPHDETAGGEPNATDDEAIAFSLDMKIALRPVGHVFLPTEVSGRVWVDPAAIMGAVSSLEELEETAELPVPLDLEDAEASEPQEHTFRLTLDWDTTKGADPALVENTQLKSAERSWQQAQKALEADDWEGAIAPLARLTRQVPTFIDAHLFLSDAYSETGEIWSAIGELEQVVMLQPGNWVALNNLAYMYVDHDIDLERGLELAQSAYDLLEAPVPAFLSDTLGWAYYKNGDLENASWYLEDALVQLNDEKEAGMYQPEEYAEHAAELHYHLAAVYAAREMYDQAKEHLETALEYNPELEAAQELWAAVNEALAGAAAESGASA